MTDLKEPDSDLKVLVIEIWFHRRIFERRIMDGVENPNKILFEYREKLKGIEKKIDEIELRDAIKEDIQKPLEP